MTQSKPRSSFSGKIGFVLAAAGSAVGLGNIWRFPYLAARYGGGIFLLTYLLLAVSLGFTLMATEIAIGRKTGLSAIGAYRALDRRFSFLGWLGALVPVIILPYYCVIGGWVCQYLKAFLFEDMAKIASDTYFSAFAGSTLPPLILFLVFTVITATVVTLGVEKGIERVSKVMMPVLVLLTLFVAIYSVCLPGAGAGVLYYLKPDFSRFSVETVLAAMGQMFYSMSIAMGILITYGSYMKKDVSIEASAHQIELFDSGIAFLAGLMIIPAVFVFSGGNQAALNKGSGLMFVMLPKVFQSMTGGRIIGIVFFLLVLFAALTSSIALYETVVSYFQDRFHWKRFQSCLAVFGICLLLGVPSSLGNGAWKDFKLLGMDFLSFCDFITNSVMMPVVAFITCILVGYVLKPDALADEIAQSGQFRARKLYYVFIRYIAPICIALILISSVLDNFGILEL